ncbi:MAG: phosphatase PAP2 family protein [Candidatus Aenigmarchaeota archaeon]|nr:phosphatase PAP2 family protein [Candidatus Aenigmarchaeota archaeon]
MKNLNKIAVLIFLYLVILGLSLFYINSFVEEDVYLFYSVNSMTFGVLDNIIVSLSYLGSYYIWSALALLFWFRRKYETASYLLGAVLVTGIPTLLLKLLIMRPRPFEVLEAFRLVADSALSSFPSAHAVLAFALVVVLSKADKRIMLPGFIFASIVAFSRVFIGVHYPFDVIFGALMGIILGILTINLPLEKIEKTLERWRK